MKIKNFLRQMIVTFNVNLALANSRNCYKDGTYAAIEYKGEPFVTNDDSREKNLLGELWASKSNGFCKFLMATKIDDKGRNLDTQLKDFFVEFT